MNSVVLFVILSTCFATDCSCLRCFNCNSRMSWEDCNQHIKEVDCREKEICYMAHQIRSVDGQEKHHFIKSCFGLEFCSAEFCRKTAQENVNSSWCETKCCDDEDLCNDGVTPSWERAFGAATVRLRTIEGSPTVSQASQHSLLTALFVVFVFIAGLFWM